jgi:hypothetical protein
LRKRCLVIEADQRRVRQRLQHDLR